MVILVNAKFQLYLEIVGILNNIAPKLVFSPRATLNKLNAINLFKAS